MAATKVKSKKTEEDAEWSRFERAVDVVAKSPPQPKVKLSAKKSAPPKKRCKGD